MTALDPLRLTARVAKRLLVDGEISSAELAKVYLDQIAAVEPRVRAYILVTYDNAAKYSTKVDREMQAMRGPLAGGGKVNILRDRDVAPVHLQVAA